MPTPIRQKIEVIELFAPKDRLPGRLSRAHYDVLTSDAAGMSYADIAQLVGCPLGTVKSRINRARLMLDRLVRLSDAPPAAPTEKPANV